MIQKMIYLAENLGFFELLARIFPVTFVSEWEK